MIDTPRISYPEYYLRDGQIVVDIRMEIAGGDRNSTAGRVVFRGWDMIITTLAPKVS